MRKITYLIFFLLFLRTMAGAQPGAQPGTRDAVRPGATREPIKVTDLLKIKSIGDIKLNKEGTKAVFVLTSIDPDPDPKAGKWDYKYMTTLYLVPSDGSAPPRPLTAKENASQPAWSPDGRQLAFVRAVDGKPQIFLLSFDGGEPVQFTHFHYGAAGPKWSPDGKELLFSARVGLKELIKDSVLNPGHTLPPWPAEKPGTTESQSLRPSGAKANPDGSMEEIRAWLDNNVTDKKAKVVTKLDFQDEMEVNAELSFSEFFVQSLQAGSVPAAVTHGFFQYAAADYTPDGKQLIITAHIDSTEHPDRALESEIYTADRNGTHLRLLLGEKGKVYTGARLSPDGRWLAAQYGTTSFVTVPQVIVVPFGGSTAGMGSHSAGEAGASVIPIDRATGNFAWGQGDKYLYFTTQSNGGAPLYRVTLETKKVEQLTDYNSGTGSFDLQSDRLVFSRTEVSDPSEVYSADGSLLNLRRISAFNTDWLSGRELSLPEKHAFTNGLGETIEYWVMKPVNYVAGQHYPLLLDIHGGPSAMWGPGESSMWHEFQFFCGKGYGVIYCNPRGSGGYGLDFLRANVKDWGTGPTSDVLTALDKTVAEGWADTSKLVVSGGSYAGYLVAWIVGHDHRFKAACAQRGVYDLATFFGEGNAWRLVPNYFGGYPWEPAVKQLLQHESPITYVQDITTPLIIFHGENDRRTGFVQGEMLYRSLKVLGRPVEYVRHPGATHEITRSGENRQRIDQMLRTYEFFERWVGK